MASVPLSLLAGLFGPKLLKTVMSETGNVHSLETTEGLSQAMAGGGSSAAVSETQLNVPLVQQPMVKQSAGGVLSADQMQATAAATVKELMADATQMATFTVSPSTPVGTVLYSTEISPSRLNGTNETRITYLSKLFTFWRGSLKFRFIYTKTILIQCKLAAVFVPGATRSSPAPSPAMVTYYKHHVIMNPANEEQYDLEVPFISTTPFNQMDQSTGMLYVMVWQPLVISVGDANTLPVTVLCSSSSLDFHEYAVVPTYDNPVLPAVGSEYMYQYLQTGSTKLTSAAADVGTVAMLSDSGVTLTSKPSKFTAGRTWDMNHLVPQGAAYISANSEAYSPSTHRTIYGTPAFGEAAIWERAVACPVGAASAYAATFNVYISSNGNMWCKPFALNADFADLALYPQTQYSQFVFPQYVFSP